MFDNRQHQDHPHPSVEQSSLSSIRDTLSSLSYRMSELEGALSRKMDRGECLNIVEKKVSHGQLRQCMEELENRVKEEHRQEEDRNNRMQEIAIQKINELGKRLKSVGRGEAKKGRERVLKPQELFLESNETMFSLLIDEVAKLQERDGDLQKQLDSRNRKMISLNNQVCKKLQRMQRQLQEKLYVRVEEGKHFGSSWSQLQRQSKPTVHKGAEMEGSTFESVRLELIAKNVEGVQRELLGKLNIKDVLPLVKQHMQTFTDSVRELREYVQESMDSTRKILSSQTEINHQLSLGLRTGWWHSFAQENEIALFNKQLLNLVPQILEYPSGHSCPNFIHVAQQGLYLLRIYPLTQGDNLLSSHSSLSSSPEFQLLIGTEVRVVGGECVLRLQKGSEVRVILRSHVEIVLSLQKL